MAELDESTEPGSSASGDGQLRHNYGGMNIRSGQYRAACPVCCRSMPVTKAGLLQVHGPLSNRCKGSRMSPSLSPSTHSPRPLSVPSSTATPSVAEGIQDMRTG